MSTTELWEGWQNEGTPVRSFVTNALEKRETLEENGHAGAARS